MQACSRRARVYLSRVCAWLCLGWRVRLGSRSLWSVRECRVGQLTGNGQTSSTFKPTLCPTGTADHLQPATDGTDTISSDKRA